MGKITLIIERRRKIVAKRLAVQNLLAIKLCRILGVEPKEVRRIVITLTAQAGVRVRIDLIGTEDLEELDFEKLLEDAEVEII